MHIELFNNCERNTLEFYDFDSRVQLSPTSDYIEFGADNMFPEKLVWLYENSPTQSSIINKKSEYAAGQKILTNDPINKKRSQSINNGKGLYNLLKNLQKDYQIHNGFCIQVLFYKNIRKIKDIIYQDFTQVRRGFSPDTNEDGTKDQGVWITPSWQRKWEYLPKYYDYFREEYLTGEMPLPDKPVFLYFYEDAPAREWYPLPKYNSAIQAIFSEIEAQNYIYYQFKNSFNPSGILRLPTTPSEEEQGQIKKQIRDDMQGTENAGRIFATFGDKEELIEWIPFSNTVDHSGVLDLQDRNQRMIVTSHQLSSPTLIGLPGGASLGGDGGTIESAAEEFYNQQILPARETVKNEVDKLILNMRDSFEYSIKESYLYKSNNEQ
jgi:hypothetical protein